MKINTGNVFNIEAEAFEVCNTDSIEGLTWSEVQNCEVIVFFKNS